MKKLQHTLHSIENVKRDTEHAKNNLNIRR